MGTKQFSNYEDLITFTRASGGHALRPVSYGTELVDTANTASAWTIYGTENTVTQNGDAVEIAYVTNSNGAYEYLRENHGLSQDPEAGKLYQITAEVKVNTGNVYLELYHASSIYESVLVSSTDYQKVVFNLVVTDVDSVLLKQSGMGTGEVFSIKNISVKEVTFDQPDGTLTLFEHPEDIPRVEWDADRNRLGLLVEESRTNEIPFSQKFDDSTWAKGGSISVTDNVVTAPDGTQTGCLVTAADDTTDYVVRSSVTSNGQTKSIWARTVSGTGKVTLLGHNSVSAAMFDLTETWQRFDLPVDTSQVGGSNFYVVDFRGAAATLTEVYIWGAQLETGNFPTSYIKSESIGAKTRSADVASVPVADFGFNTGAGTFVAEFQYQDPEEDDSNYLIGGTAQARVMYNNAATNVWQTYDGNGAVTFSAIDSDDGRFKLAVAVKTDSITVTSKDGSITGSNAAFTKLMENLAGQAIYIGGGSTQSLNGHIKSIKYYPRRLTDAQLQDLTS